MRFDSEPAPCGCRKLKALQSLEVCGGGVTDSGVACLQDLSQLRSLSLAQVTPQSTDDLHCGLPTVTPLICGLHACWHRAVSTVNRPAGGYEITAASGL